MVFENIGSIGKMSLDYLLKKLYFAVRLHLYSIQLEIKLTEGEQNVYSYYFYTLW